MNTFCFLVRRGVINIPLHLAIFPEPFIPLFHYSIIPIGAKPLSSYWMEKARESLESAESEYLVKELLDQAKGFVGEMEKLLIQSTDL